jgi:hypothetical protein
MKKNILFIFYLLSFSGTCLSQQNLTSFPFVINGNFPNTTHTYYFSSGIVSPGSSSLNCDINSNSNIDFIAGRSVTLEPGFHAGPFNSGAHFTSKIDNSIQSILISPNPLTSIFDGIVHVNKWEKLEIGFTIPAQYQVGIDNFFNHYYSGISHTSACDYDLNPYADDSLVFFALFTKPDGTQKRVWGFFMRQAKWSSNDEDGELEDDVNNPSNKYFFHVRFAPDQDDANSPWSVSFHFRAPNSAGVYNNIDLSGYQFICEPPLSDNNGYLNVNSNSGNQFLAFDNLKPFFGIGGAIREQNHLFWFNTNQSDKCHYYLEHYKRDFDDQINTMNEISSYGGNFGRIYGGFSYEWFNLGVYDKYTAARIGCERTTLHPNSHTTPWEFEVFCPDKVLNTNNNCQVGVPQRCGNGQWQAWTLDKIFENARANRIYLQQNLFVNPPGQNDQQDGWGDNCYVQSLTPSDNTTYSTLYAGNTPFSNFSISYPGENWHDNTHYYFTEPLFRKYFKRNIKYFLARWGYSVNLATIEFWNEIDATFHYSDNSSFISSNINCPENRNYYKKEQIVLDGIKDAFIDLKDYVKGTITNDPVTSPLGEPKRILYNSFASIPTPAQYEFMDIVDIHDYNGHRNRNLNFKATTTDKINEFNSTTNLSKPIHFGECGSYHSVFRQGTAQQLDVSNTPMNGIASSIQNNNYDVSFHNLIWGTSFIGNFTSGIDFLSTIVHRWKYANIKAMSSQSMVINLNHTPPANVITIKKGEQFSYSVDNSTGIFTNHTDLNTITLSNLHNNVIKSFYEDYLPLSNFLSLVNNEFASPLEVKNYWDEKIEAYYLKSSDKAFGWIHNVNKYWENTYIGESWHLPYTTTTTIPYTINSENYYGCYRIQQPPDKFKLPGFLQSTCYDLHFYPTRNGNYQVPPSRLVTSDLNGDLLIDFSVDPATRLDCDDHTADYAFIATISPSCRIKNYNKTIKENKLLYNLSPNPFDSRISIQITNYFSLFTGEKQVLKIGIYNLVSEQILLTETNFSQYFDIDLSNLASGVYTIKLTLKDLSSVSKIIKM